MIHPRRMHIHPHHKGFTLVEFMIAIFILGILSSWGIQSFLTLQRQTRATTYINEFLFQLYYARSEAIKRNQTVTLCASKDQTVCGKNWSKGWIMFVDFDQNQQRSIEEPLLTTHPNLEGGDTLTYGGSATSPRLLQFTPTGTIQQNASSFTYQTQGGTHTKKICINRLGRARLENSQECRK